MPKNATNTLIDTITGTITGRIMSAGKALALGAALAMCVPVHAYIPHEVSRSETLWGIAYKYGVPADAIVQANPQADKGLKPGMKLRIPEAKDLDANGNLKDQQPVPKAAEAKAPEARTPEAKTTETKVPEAKAPEAKAQSTVASALEYRPEETGEPQAENVYVARFGDTLSSVSQKTGVSINELLRCNPLVDPKHLPEGYIVRLSEDAPYIIGNESITLVDSVIYRVQPPVDQSVATQADDGTRTVALLLPFDVGSETISRQSLLATEFYKGFLMAVKDNTGKGTPVKVIAIDTQCDNETLSRQLDGLLMQNVDVIIPPEDETQLPLIDNFALDNNIFVLNVLNIRDEAYQSYPNVAQANISQKLMYQKAIETLLQDFDGYTPVILDMEGGKDDKASFVDELRKACKAKGKDVLTLTYSGHLTADDLGRLPAKGKYVFVPKSGSADTFSKFARTLSDAADAGTITCRVFGYPEWIMMRGEQEELLHSLQAVIYARFYADADERAAREFDESYTRWYGYQMEDVYPSQAILGYDTGQYVLTTLDKKRPQSVQGKFESGSYRGIQSAYKFVRDDDDIGESAGMVNDTIYIIEYFPGAGVYVRTR